MNKTVRVITKSIFSVLLAVLLVAMIIGTTIAFENSVVVSAFLNGTGTDFSNATEELKSGDALNVQLAEESITLLRNEKVSDGKPALPLREDVTEISLFGYGSTDTGFLMRGVGSGSSTIVDEKKLTLIDGITGKVRDFDIDEKEYTDENGKVDEAKKEQLKKEFGESLTKYAVNQKISEIYAEHAKTTTNARGDQSKLVINDSYTNRVVYTLDEPIMEDFTDGIMRKASEASKGVALFVVSRDGGENIGEQPRTQTVGGEKDTSRTYLELSSQEEEMLKYIKKYFDTTIVILNTTNAMHLGFLEDPDLGIDACLYVGLPGQSGTRAIPEILSGKINPSGKMTDIITKSADVAAEFDPTWNNYAAGKDIIYIEDIYHGYKWYETAAADNFAKAGGAKFVYDDVVMYPFGHGLSYSTFEKKIDSIYYYNGDEKVELNDSLDGVPSLSTPIYVDVKVRNTGDVAGKEVVELYFTPEYKKGGIEKAEINLLAFAKSGLINPKDTHTVTCSFTLYDMASYDAYDRNENKFWGYELEGGKYEIKLMENSHDLIESRAFNLAKGIQIDKDPVTGTAVVNRFTNIDDPAYNGTYYAGCGVDGKEAGVAQKWLTRSDFAGTFPTGKASSYTDESVVKSAKEYLNDAPYKDVNKTFPEPEGEDLYLWKTADGKAPTRDDLDGKGVEIAANYDLFEQLADYNNDKVWNKLLSQMSASEMKTLIEFGGFRRATTESIGLRRMYDNDGPAGFNGESLGDQSGQWTAYPCEALMGCSWNQELMFLLGRAMGAEANATGVNGWYAPGVNLHRSNYNARNFEYYSEDGVLSGKLAVQVIAGAKTNGLTCYLKHFTCSEEGPNPTLQVTWITEQNLRENFLKPFEIAVKGIDVVLETKDDAGNVTKTQTIRVCSNGIMTAFNCVGASWAGANYAMNVEVLREEWGFNGVVITDWTSYGTGWGDVRSYGTMNTTQGVRSGNDLYLDPNNHDRFLDMENEISAYCARIACKNIIYSVADCYNTYNVVKESGAELDSYQTTLSDTFKTQSEWWQPTLIALTVVVGLGCVVGILFIWRVPQKLFSNRKGNKAATGSSSEK